jgi:hypothetical protein
LPGNKNRNVITWFYSALFIEYKTDLIKRKCLKGFYL